MSIRTAEAAASTAASPSFCDVAIVFPFAWLHFLWLIIRSLRLVAGVVIASVVLIAGSICAKVRPFANGPSAFSRG
jgi:predicted membrane-bound dolichyl-phosphate-mannose-protein mannosyltransferase